MKLTMSTRMLQPLKSNFSTSTAIRQLLDSCRCLILNPTLDVSLDSSLMEINLISKSRNKCYRRGLHLIMI